MSVFFSKQTSEEFDGAIVLIDGAPVAIDSSHANYEDVIDLLMSGLDILEEEIRDMIRPFDNAAAEMIRLSERVTAGGNVLYFDGDPIDGSLSSHIIRILQEEGTAKEGGFRNFVAFLEKLMQNPSEVSRQHLYDFVTHHGITITPEGDLALYKSTWDDGTPTYAGYGIVTTPDGVITKYENGLLPNAVGNIIEIPRSMVDENRNSACSTGLHVGAFSFARGYSRKLWDVVVNPRDVVAVPHDASSAKIRVCRYEVVSVNEEKKEFEGPSILINIVVEDEYEDEEHSDECEEGCEECDDFWLDEEDEDNIVSRPASLEDQLPALVVVSNSRVPEYEDLIKGLMRADPTVSLNRYKSKRITAGRRDQFAQAAHNLGYKL